MPLPWAASKTKQNKKTTTKKHGQQVEGGDSSCLLHAGEASPGVLHLEVKSSASERHGPVGAHPEEGHKDDPTDGTPHL